LTGEKIGIKKGWQLYLRGDSGKGDKDLFGYWWDRHIFGRGKVKKDEGTNLPTRS